MKLDTTTKDCTCLDGIHIGPHWMHMAAYDRTVGLKHLREGNLAAYGKHEAVRLKDLYWFLKQCGFTDEQVLPVAVKNAETAYRADCMDLLAPILAKSSVK